MKRSLVSKSYVRTQKGEIAYLEAGGAGLPVALFVHGIPTSGYLWRHVLRALEGRFRCLAPDLMGLGDTVVDVPKTDFAMPSQAEMLEQFLDALGIERAHLIAHDQGGAAAQLLVTCREHRVDKLVLTNCVCFDNWPVPTVRHLMHFARIPGSRLLCRSGLVELLQTRSRLSQFRRGVSNRAALSDEAIGEYLRPLRGSNEERERFFAFLLAGSPRHTMAVLPRLRELRRPTMVLWAADDRYIPLAWGKRLYGTIPSAHRFDVIPGAGHFWPEELPAPFAERIGEFLDETANVHAAASSHGTAGASPATPPKPDVPGERLAKRRCPKGPPPKTETAQESKEAAR